MRANKKHGLVFLGLLLIFSITVLASSNCPSKEEYRVRVKDATRDYLTSPGHEKLMQLQDMFKIYATHDFTGCLEKEALFGTPTIRSVHECSDGTAYGSCSATKPWYCDNGKLVSWCSVCGCYENRICNAENVCVNKTEVREVILLIVEADRVLVQNAINFAKSLTVLDPSNQGRFDEEIALAQIEFAEAESHVSTSEFQDGIEHFKLAWEHAQNAIRIANKPYSMELSCSMTSGSCNGVSVFKIQGLDNGHAQLSGNYPYTVCCSGVSGLGTESSGTIVLGFAGEDNSHVQKGSIGTYHFKAYLSAPSGITCDYVEGNGDGYSICEEADFDTCLASMQDSDNSHIGDCSAYNVKVCCKVGEEGGGFWSWLGFSWFIDYFDKIL